MKKDGKDYDYINAVWVNMANYMKFYQAWVITCATLNRSVDNPNRVLARRWSKRGKMI